MKAVFTTTWPCLNVRGFLKNIGILIEEDGEEVLPSTMDPVSVDDFDSYLSPYVGDEAILALLLGTIPLTFLCSDNLTFFCNLRSLLSPLV